MAQLQKINPSWDKAIVAASGPSLTPAVIHSVRMARIMDKWGVIAVNDSYKVMPWADAMYACDNRWWDVHKRCYGFRGKKWSTSGDADSGNDKREFADDYGINLIYGKDAHTFSTDPSVIHYGLNSGFQAINLAILHGAKYIVLVGFDHRHVGGKSHFFGDHPKELTTAQDHNYQHHTSSYSTAAKRLPPGVRIVNATPGSALKAFPMMELSTAIDWKEADRHCRTDRDRAVAHA